MKTLLTVILLLISHIGIASELVILLHGMGRTSVSMWNLEEYLEDHGFEVLNWNYDGFFTKTSTLAEEFLQLVDEQPEDKTIHIVTHSLGGIIVRQALGWEARPQIQNVVMLAPPHQGSKRADMFSGPLSWILHPIIDLTTDETSYVRRLPPMLSGHVAVIAAEHDILVEEISTYLPEMVAHLTVDCGHTWIMNNKLVQEQILSFLRTGKFAW